MKRDNFHAIIKDGVCISQCAGAPSMLQPGEDIMYFSTREQMQAHPLVKKANDKQRLVDEFNRSSGYDRSQIYTLKARQAEKYLAAVKAGYTIEHDQFRLLFREHEATKELTGWTLDELAERIINNAIGDTVIDKEIAARRAELALKTTGFDQ